MSENRTKEQIEQNRQLALERRKQTREARRQTKIQQQSNAENLAENSLKPKLNPADVTNFGGKVSALTVTPATMAEQVERNRLNAIEKAKSNNWISPEQAAGLVTKEISPGKIQVPTKAGSRNDRSAPYLKPQNLANNAAAANSPSSFCAALEAALKQTKTVPISESIAVQVERNRLAGIAKAKANNLISPEDAEGLATKKISPGKIQVPMKTSARNDHATPQWKQQNLSFSPAVAPNPSTSSEARPAALNTLKALPPSKTMTTNNRQSPYQKPSTPKPSVPVLCKLEAVSATRFVAKVDNYNETVINEFKKLRSKSYGELS